jgi:hypothetical protein
MISYLTLLHLIGLALAVGCATAKLVLLLRIRSDHALLPSFLATARPLTRLIILGLALLTLSGIGWLLDGYPWDTRLILKLVLVGAIWVLGPIIDNVIEPRFRKAAPEVGQPASDAFTQALNRYVMIETTATGLFYLIVVMWVLG